jgi:predicted Zn-dependent protease
MLRQRSVRTQPKHKTRHDMRAFPSLTLALAATVATLAACAVSQQREVEMGAGYAAQIEKELPLVRDPEIVRYINVLGDSLAGVTDDRSLTWHFYVVDAKEINAFALPGGYIFINRGLVEKAADMAQVAGVLGHEIGHVTKRHSIKQMQKAQGANIGMTVTCILTNVCTNAAAGDLIQLAAGGVFAKFSRDDESEADAEGVKTVIRAGIDPAGIPQMFRILLDERKARPAGVDAFFLSHPLEENRIATTQALIAQQPRDALRGLTQDSPNFQAFKKRLAALPPSPPTKKAGS